MHQQLTNLSDKELISRARKLKDREAEGVLMDRYSHLLVAVSLPHGDQHQANPGVVFPALMQRLSASLKTQTIYKANEWMLHIVNGYFSNPDKNIPFYPSRDVRDLLHIENKVERASTNAIEREELVIQLAQALQRLPAEEQELLRQFYLEHHTFSDIAAQKGIDRHKVRQLIKAAKTKLARLYMNQSYVK